MIGEAFPADPVVAEENAAVLREPGQQELLRGVVTLVRNVLPETDDAQVIEAVDRGCGRAARRFWALDPLDGTKGFLRRGQYVVALALIEDGEVRVGALGCPRLKLDIGVEGGEGAVLLGIRGSGAWVFSWEGEDRRRLEVSKETSLVRASILCSNEPEHSDLAALERLMATLKVAAPPIGMDSQAKFAVLASGQADLAIRIPSPLRPGHKERIWDFAAGCLLVEEAGGKVTDLRGAELDFGEGRELLSAYGIVASNGELHDSLLTVVRQMGIVPRTAGAQ
jgi:3'(2'), 5'-bisphosphate nucleotidase